MTISQRKKTILLWFAAIIACAVSFVIGWFLEPPFNLTPPPAPLRLGGYQYISPLLACNFSSVKSFAQDQPVINAVQSVISTHQNAGDVANVSVYFADLSKGAWASVNGNEKYYPASLGKVPIMMAYYAMAEDDSSILLEGNEFPVGAPDQNAQQEIPTTAAITPGKFYTNEELIGYMIKYSDNNAAEALTALAPTSSIQNVEAVYGDLQVPYTTGNITTPSNVDIMSPQQYAILFRALYNATYLSRDYSEKALQLMTQTTFTQGIVAGVPSSTLVSHKYGLASFTNGGVPYQWELHDCGIVYAPSHTYLACIMTKGVKSIAAQEGTIADISRAIYNVVSGGNQ